MPPLVIKPLVIIDIIFSHNKVTSKANNTFLDSLRENDVKAQVDFTFKVMERVRVNYY